MSSVTNDEFQGLVDKIWNRTVQASDPIDVLNIRLNKIKIYFKGWGSDKFGHDKKLKEDLRLVRSLFEDLEEDGPLPPELYSRKVDVNFELHDMLVNEKMYWLQHSHECWLLKGDCITYYFHKTANGHKRNYTTHVL